MVNNNFFRTNMRINEISLEKIQKKIANARLLLSQKDPAQALTELDEVTNALPVLQLSADKLTEINAEIQLAHDDAVSLMQSMRLRN